MKTCPICDKPISTEPGNEQGVCRHTRGHYFSLSDGVAYHRYHTDGDWVRIVTRGNTLACSTMRIYAAWKNDIELDRRDVDFDPKNPQPIIDKIRMLEALGDQ